MSDLYTLHPAEDWHEDYGPVLWHYIDDYGGICEAPIVSQGGTELAEQQPWPAYYSHWSRLPMLPQFPLRALEIGPPRAFICDHDGTVFPGAIRPAPLAVDAERL